MKNLLIEIIKIFLVLLFIGLLIFGISVALDPNWLNQENWELKLSKEIIVGSVILIEAALFWILKEILDDSIIKKVFIFLFTDKYHKIKKTVNSFSNSQISREKNSGKYIEEIFIETNDVKDSLRYFSDPQFFYPKVKQDIQKDIYRSSFFDTLTKIYFPIKNLLFPKLRNISKIGRITDVFINQIEVLRDYKSISNEDGSIKEEYIDSIPKDKRHVSEYFYLDMFHYGIDRETERAIKNLQLLSNKVVLLTSIAGKGKTNLICDFSKNFLIRKNMLCLYFTGRDFNQIGTNESIEDAILRIVFSDDDLKFNQLLDVVQLNKKLDFLFIIIDGINEHNDLKAFELALEQFILRSKNKNIKIILTCREEYIKVRFNKLINIEGVSKLSITDSRYHFETSHHLHLIECYFEHFNIPIKIEAITKEIREVFFKDKLMLRFYCEAFEGKSNHTSISGIYRFEVFEKYYEKKIKEINGLKKCLEEIVNYMIKHAQFTNIKLEDLSKESQEIIELTYDSSIIIRKDIVTIPDVTPSKKEVMNFVYDEFREYLISSYILIMWHKNEKRDEVKILMDGLIAADNQISEGLQKFLCSWAINNIDDELLSNLKKYDLFESVFINNIFESQDENISESLKSTLLKIIVTNPKYFWETLIKVIYRYDVNIYKNLNIEDIDLLIINFNDQLYEDLIKYGYHKGRDIQSSYFDLIVSRLKEILNNSRISGKSRLRILRLFLIISGINEISSIFGNVKHPAIKAFWEFREDFTEEEILKSIKELEGTIKLKSILPILNFIKEKIGS